MLGVASCARGSVIPFSLRTLTSHLPVCGDVMGLDGPPLVKSDLPALTFHPAVAKGSKHYLHYSVRERVRRIGFRGRSSLNTEETNGLGTASCITRQIRQLVSHNYVTISLTPASGMRCTASWLRLGGARSGGFGLLLGTRLPGHNRGREEEVWFSGSQVVTAVFCLSPQVRNGRLWWPLKSKKDDNGIGTAIDFVLSNARLVLGVGGAAMLGIATLSG